MILTTTDNIAIHLQDSPRDVTARRYKLFNQYWIKQGNTGSGGEDLASHLNRMSLFLTNRDVDAATGEFNNYLLTLHSIQHAETPLALALACLTTSIDGEACTDLSEDGLQRTADRLLASELTQQQLTEAVDQLKKNFSLR